MRLRQANKIIKRHFNGASYNRLTIDKAMRKSPSVFFRSLMKHYELLKNIAVQMVEELA